MTDNEIDELKKLYNTNGWHSQYQRMPQFLNELQGIEAIKPKYEKERMDYVLEKVGNQFQRVLDIGGNSGYFTFESIRLFQSAEKVIVDYYDGSKSHADFVRLSAKILDLSNQVNVHKIYYTIDTPVPDNGAYDIAYCMNVVHHMGRDFYKCNDKTIIKDEIIKYLNSLSSVTKILVFQMGYNWQGDINNCLFDNGTKKEMEDYLLSGIKGYWNILGIGIAEREDGNYYYRDVSEQNNIRIDDFGEFLNRPLFILETRKW